jgi:hypothetical protein
VAARVLSSIYMGTHTQVQLALGAATWWANFGPDAACAVGETLWVRLPGEHLWILPQE